MSLRCFTVQIFSVSAYRSKSFVRKTASAHSRLNRGMQRLSCFFTKFAFQFFRLCIGAGIFPPREIKRSGEAVFTGMMGAEPRSPPKEISSPTPRP